MLELLHINLIEPMQVESVARKRYISLCVDDFPILSLTKFMRDKSNAFEAFEELWLKLAKEYSHRLIKITRLRSDHGKEFDNSMFKKFCNMNGLKHEFSAHKTPQQNEVVVKKNITLQEMAKVMLNVRNVPIKF